MGGRTVHGCGPWSTLKKGLCTHHVKWPSPIYAFVRVMCVGSNYGSMQKVFWQGKRRRGWIFLFATYFELLSGLLERTCNLLSLEYLKTFWKFF